MRDAIPSGYVTQMSEYVKLRVIFGDCGECRSARLVVGLLRIVRDAGKRGADHG